MMVRIRRLSPLASLLAAIFFFTSQVFAIQAVLGLDLGTEYIKAALVKPGIPLDIVLTKDSRRKETSAVAFKPSRAGPQGGQFPERFYGSDAMAFAARFPHEVYPNLKTLLGLPAEDDIVVEYAARHPALRLESHPIRGTSAFKSSTLADDEDAWLVEELLAMELQSIQKNAEAAAGDGSTVRSAVFTIPPFYTAEERRAVQSAAELAGFKVLGLVSDGLAVGLNYATSRQFPNLNEGAKPEYHLVFDMGAGSTKASVMRFQSRTVKDIGKFNKTIQEVQVLGSGWDRTLGGDVLNSLIIDDMIAQFVGSKGAQKVSATIEGVRKHGRAVAKLTKEAERLRHVLSANQNTQANFEGLYEDVDFKYKITRAEFEAMAEQHAARVGGAIKDALKMANLDIADLDSVILHGGATRTPFVQKALEQVVGSAEKIRTNVNSDEAAAFGAGFRAADLSPSFRVKEIRILEGSSYPITLKWTNANDRAQAQRLWSAISPIGGPPKEITFTEEEDFTSTFFQQVGEDARDIATFTTKNLTATVAAIKEKYPSCVDSGVNFRVASKLSSDNGEVEIVKAVVECEAEIKEGIIDGVKNLFGFGKKDQIPLKADDGSEDAGATDGDDQDAVEIPDAATTEDASAEPSTEGVDAENAGSTEELKTDAKKIELVYIPVEFVLEKAGTPVLSKDQVKKLSDRLKAFSASDRARVQRDEAQNQLEGYTYRIRDILEDEALVAVSTNTERTKLAELSRHTSEWLSDEGDDATKDELKSRLKKLQALVTPLQTRAEEAASRPERIKKLKEALEQTSSFVDTNRKQMEAYEAWHAADASASAAATASPSTEATKDIPDASEDSRAEDNSAKEKTMEDVLEEKGPIPPLYTADDIDELDELYQATAKWLGEIEPKQEKLTATDDPVLLVKDLDNKREKLEKAGRDLALKGVRNFNAKKKAEEKEKNKKKKQKEEESGSKTESAKKTKFTIDVGGEEKVFDESDLEDMINNMSEDDWETVRKQAQDEAERKGHDEL